MPILLLFLCAGLMLAQTLEPEKAMAAGVTIDYYGDTDKGLLPVST